MFDARSRWTPVVKLNAQLALLDRPSPVILDIVYDCVAQDREESLYSHCLGRTLELHVPILVEH